MTKHAERVADVITGSLVGLGIERSSISGDKLLKKDLELDSTEVVQILLDVKRHLNVDMDIESKRDITVGELCTIVKQHAEQTDTAN